MANYATLKAAIQQVVKTNGNNEITGALLQQSLLAMVNSLGADYQFVGIANTSTNPGTPDQNVFYLAVAGTYPNFNNLTIADGRLGALKYNGSWSVESVPIGKDYDDDITRLDNKAIKLTGFGGNASAAGATSVGDVYYNSSSKLLRKVIALSPLNETTVPYVSGAIYTKGGEFYIWDGTHMVAAPTKLYDFTTGLNAAVFGYYGKGLTKTGTVTDTANFWVTPFIPVKVGETVKVGGYSGGTSYNYSLMCLYDENKTFIAHYGNASGDGYKELEMVIPSGAAYMRVGTRNDNAGILYYSRSYAYAAIISKLIESANSIADIQAGLIQAQNDIVKINAGISPVLALAWGAKLNGNANSHIDCKTPIVLQSNGDSIEIEFGNIDSATLQTGGYAFTKTPNQNINARGLFVANLLAVRGDDGTWIVQQSDNIAVGSNKKLKMEYSGGNMYFYVDGTLKFTYTGQKKITIQSFGNGMAAQYGYWSGVIKSIKVNGTAITFADFFTFATDAALYRVSGFLTDQQQQQIDAAEQKPAFVVEASANQVIVYFKANESIYGKLPINHIVNHSDDAYSDFWGIEDDGHTIGYFSKYSGGIFNDMSDRLLVGAENEFAIQFYVGDFTGGTHGDERIDLAAGCYVVFLVDGKEYSITDLVNLGRVSCDSFGYRQKSALYSMYSVTGTHDIIAYHTKRTDFVKGGFVTRNYVEMQQALTARVAYSGLVCVHKNCANYVVNNAGTVFQATHPSTTTPIAGFVNKTNRRVRMYNGNASCELDSKVVGGNVDAFNNAPVDIEIDDRANDAKYYCRMPYQVALNADSVFEFECSVKWDYKLQQL